MKIGHAIHDCMNNAIKSSSVTTTVKRELHHHFLLFMKRSDASFVFSCRSTETNAILGTLECNDVLDLCCFFSSWFCTKSNTIETICYKKRTHILVSHNLFRTPLKMISQLVFSSHFECIKSSRIGFDAWILSANMKGCAPFISAMVDRVCAYDNVCLCNVWTAMHSSIFIRDAPDDEHKFEWANFIVRVIALSRGAIEQTMQFEIACVASFSANQFVRKASDPSTDESNCS